LIARSIQLEVKVRRLDATIHASATPSMPDGNPVERQMGLLKAAFEQDAV
jgi:regulator of CtrA degradation